MEVPSGQGGTAREGVEDRGGAVDRHEDVGLRGEGGIQTSEEVGLEPDPFVGAERASSARQGQAVEQPVVGVDGVGGPVLLVWHRRAERCADRGEPELPIQGFGEDQGLVEVEDDGAHRASVREDAPRPALACDAPPRREGRARTSRRRGEGREPRGRRCTWRAPAPRRHTLPAMLVDRYPYFFDPAHAAREQVAATFRAGGGIRARVCALAAAGLLDPSDVRGLAVARYQLAYHDALTDLAFIIQELGTFPLRTAGGFEDVLAAARAGDSVVAFGLTEPEAGSDVRALATRAVQHGGEWRLTGTKHFISNAPDCDRATVFARTDAGIGCFLVDNPHTSAQKVAGHSIGRIELDDTPARFVSAKGLGLAFATLERCRPSVGLAAVGMARRALDETVTYVGARRQFGAPLAQLPAVQAKVADMALELEAATLTALHACWRRDTAPPEMRTGYESAIGKVTATEAAQRIIDSAVQLHGGAGVEEDSVVQQLYRNIRPLRIYEGATDVLKTVIAARWLEAS